VFGVLPLAIASGPGAGSQNAIGRAVVGGTLTATFLAIFFVPLFFVSVKRCFRLDKPAPCAEPSGDMQPVPAE
jgi:HAE1 family hydrophobic/amphiphilic exporter-1/multidrug efflux pump